MALITARIQPIDAFSSSTKPVKIVLPKDQKDFATMVSIDYDETSGSPGNITHDWKETEIWFQADRKQCLYIALASLDMGSNNSPRFHVHKIKSPAAVSSVHYVDGKVWKKFGIIQEEFPSGTLMIRIEFEMERNTGAEKVELIVMDTVTGTPFSVDPLVGNDPP